MSPRTFLGILESYPPDHFAQVSDMFNATGRPFLAEMFAALAMEHGSILRRLREGGAVLELDARDLLVTRGRDMKAHGLAAWTVYANDKRYRASTLIEALDSASVDYLLGVVEAERRD